LTQCIKKQWKVMEMSRDLIAKHSHTLVRLFEQCVSLTWWPLWARCGTLLWATRREAVVCPERRSTNERKGVACGVGN
jgi:hypothetical protein